MPNCSSCSKETIYLRLRNDIWRCAKCVDDQMSTCRLCAQLYVTCEGCSTPTYSHICPTCACEFTTCPSCTESHPPSEIHPRINGYPGWCSRCVADKLARCRHCGTYVLREEVVARSGRFYCSRCAPPEHDLRNSRPWTGHIIGEEFSIIPNIEYGIELECIYKKFCGKAIVDTLPQWGWCRDSSIENSEDNPVCVEFNSPIFIGDRGLYEINRFCDLINNEGATVNRSCGLHVHVKPNSNEMADIVEAVKAWVYIEDWVYAAFPTRRESRHCQPFRCRIDNLRGGISKTRLAGIVYGRSAMNDGMLRELSSSKYNDARYHALNLHSYFHRGTFEYRMHTGTTNPKKIEHWIELCTKVTNNFNHSNPATGREQVLSTLRAETLEYFNQRMRGN